jgi:hypothetical protein
LQGDLQLGTELLREGLEAVYGWRPGGGRERLRARLDLLGRQYRSGSRYTASSDSWEGRGELRATPLAPEAWSGDVLLVGAWYDYRTPSTLEQDRRDLELGGRLRAPPLAATDWSLGLSRTWRSYPDSAAIDRHGWVAEARLDRPAVGGEGLRAFHRSERRVVADETARPSAWTHWTDLRAGLRAGAGELLVEAESEVWRYDTETSVYFDSWRWGGFLGYRLGDILTAAWQFGVVGERFAAGDQPETYDQVGLRAGLESYGGAVSGGVTVEYGYRSYRNEASDASGSSDLADLLSDDGFGYSDFDYWDIWLVGTWHVAEGLSLDALASYRPERHSESQDDAALGFASLRLVWRP